MDLTPRQADLRSPTMVKGEGFMADVVTWANCIRAERGQIHIAYDHPTNSKRQVSSVIEIPIKLLDAEVTILCEELENFIIGKSQSSAGTAVYIFNRIANFLRAEGAPIPAAGSSDWQTFLFDFFDHFMLRSKSYVLKKASKVRLWAVARRYFKQLQTNNIIPENTLLPTSQPHKNSLNMIGGVSPTLSKEKKVKLPETASEIFPKKFLISNDAHLTSDEFLDILMNRLTAANAALITGCSEYWINLKKCHALGDELISAIDSSELKDIIESKVTYTLKHHPANPQKPLGINWFLAAAKYCFLNYSFTAMSLTELKRFPFFKGIATNVAVCVNVQKALDNLVQPFMNSTVSGNEGFLRLMGLLNARDCAAACAILIKENPNFTSEGLQQSNLLNVNDKPYIFSDGDFSLQIFGIEKPRASARKVSVLPSLSRMIIEDVIRCTATLRAKLKEDGDSNYRKLFIISSNRGFTNSTIMSATLASKRGNTLYNEIKQHLENAGMEKSLFALQNIRANQGILRFLQTGSFYSVALTLGNTPIVAQRHYIPSWIAERWARRVARVFAHKLVIVATHGKPWQMEASDCEDAQTLLSFVTRIITGAQTKDDALSHMIRNMESNSAPLAEEIFKPLIRHGLQIKLDPESLGALYYYVETLDRKNPELNITDPSTGLTPQSLVDLANLMKYAARDPEFGNHAEWAVRSHLQGKSHLQLKLTHEQAIMHMAKLRLRIETMSVTSGSSIR